MISDIKNIYDGISIFIKYDPSSSLNIADHDKIYVLGPAHCELSENDRVILKSINWTYDFEIDSWSFKLNE